MSEFVIPGKQFNHHIDGWMCSCKISSIVSDQNNKYVITECTPLEGDPFHGYFLSISGKVDDLVFLSSFTEVLYKDDHKVTYKTKDGDVISITNDKQLIRS